MPVPSPAMPPPPAPPAGVNIVPPSQPPKPPPAPTREIKLGAPNTVADRGPAPAPPEPGSARERLSRSLRAKAGITEPTPPASPTPAASPAAAGEGESQPAEGARGEAPETPSAPATPPAAAAPATDKGKVNPWKLVDQYKGRVAELEKRMAESTGLPEAKQKEYVSRIEQLVKRNEALENEMRFVNYEASEEFQKTYDEPYQKAWKNAMADLNELVVTDPNTQQQRQVTAEDLIALCNLPLPQARQLANELYGEFADDMMTHRKAVKAVYEQRQSALKEAKEKGSQRDKERRELWAKQQQELNDFISSTWNKSNTELATHEKYGKFFTPVEGDQDGNQRLAKGFELVDRAYSESPKDPNLTPEQRAAIVKRHAAVRNRAAAFGRLVVTNERLSSEIEALKKELSQYKESTPRTGGTPAPSGQAGVPTKASDDIFGALRKLAK